MRIAVLSGKGGTGKTLVSVNLAAITKNSTYIDCDVEEPNGHLFFQPKQIQEQKVSVKIPKLNQEICDGCRKCVDFCKFNALVYIKNQLVIFDEICHSCGGCIIVCPNQALSEQDKVIGKIRTGILEAVNVNSGFLNMGEASGVPIINQLLAESLKSSNEYIFIDCPPGSSCIVMDSIMDADYCILVAEPTVFGVHNLKMVYQLVKLFDKPFGVVINKSFSGENPAVEFCEAESIDILGQIPFDHKLGKLNSDAKIAVRESEKYRALFSQLLDSVIKEVQHETATNP